MSSSIFPGYPAFLESAAAELGLSGATAAASRIVPFTALANLCAQAAHGDPAHLGGILAKAAEFRDQIALAHRAAELMLADVEARRSRPTPGDRVEETTQASPPDQRRPRKGNSTSRDPS